MRIPISLTIAVLFCAISAAQEQSGPPPILRIFVEHIKPGKGPAHQKSEAAFVRALAKAKSPSHYIALESMTGGDEAWFLEAHHSFAEIEQDEKLGQTEPTKTELEQASAADGESVSTESSMIAVFRPDLSYQAEMSNGALGKMHAWEVLSFRLKPGTEPRLVAAIKDMTDIYNNIQYQHPIAAYQIISGAPRGSYLILEPMTSIAEWDKYPAIMKSVRDTGGKKFLGIEATMNDIIVGDQPRLMSVNPKMSYVSPDIAAGDPDFWNPKPAMTTKAAPKAAKPGQ